MALISKTIEANSPEALNDKLAEVDREFRIERVTYATKYSNYLPIYVAHLLVEKRPLVEG